MQVSKYEIGMIGKIFWYWERSWLKVLRTQAHLEMLKRGVWYLRSYPRLIQLFAHSIEEVSTTGTVLPFGKNTIRTHCKSEAVMAVSSGEAEYYGVVSGLCQGLCEQFSFLRDWGITIPMVGFMDAITGLAIGSRHGLGRVKHVDTVFLWAQEVVTSVRAKVYQVYKKPTVDMLADLLTKPLEAQRMFILLSRMGYSLVEGRHHLALDICGA